MPVGVVVGVVVGILVGVMVGAFVGVRVVVRVLVGVVVGVFVGVGDGGISTSPAMPDVNVPLGNERKDSDTKPTVVNTKRTSPTIRSVRAFI